MDDVIARFRLIKRRRSRGSVAAVGVEDVPVRRVVISGIVGPKPGYSHCARLGMAHLDPGENVCASGRAIHANTWTPRRAAICGMRDVNVVVIGVDNINGMISSDFYGEEEMIHAPGCRLV